MANNKRSMSNSDLNGTNIKVVHANGGKYYYYILPDGSRESLGKKRKDAVEAALLLNMHFYPSGSLVDNVLNRKSDGTQFDDLIDRFTREWIPEQNYSATTLVGKQQMLSLYKVSFLKTVEQTTTQDVAEFLDQHKTNPYRRHRVLLKDLFTFATHKGYRPDNPVEATMYKTEPKRVKRRHTVEGYKSIYAIAPDWLQRAMSIALLTLQRRSDLVSIRKKDVDLKAGTIKVLQDKTRNYEEPVYIEIEMGEDLYRAVKACFDCDIHCPNLLSYKPKRRVSSKKAREMKKHPFALSHEFITKQFAKYRDLSGAYDDIEKAQRPTLHDLRALGSWLYQQQGFDLDYIRILDGHTSEKMTKKYIDGHETPKPKIVKADLKNII